MGQYFVTATSNLENMKVHVGCRTFYLVSILMMMVFSFAAVSIAFGNPIQQNQSSQTTLTGLQTEYTDTPLGIDVEHPRFSWQMSAPDGGHGYFQTAYQIVVTDSDGDEVWDTGRVESDISVHIEYAGQAIKPTTRYKWEVIVWDQDGNPVSNSSWFETGLMNSNPDLSAWDGATWIGGAEKDVLESGTPASEGERAKQRSVPRDRFFRL
ncbi:MAG: hypothetical protein U5K72_15610 [Balneolaceae bacterium]|nr:hypothetical protein [Balneolaceae bacterium]